MSFLATIFVWICKLGTWKTGSKSFMLVKSILVFLKGLQNRANWSLDWFIFWEKKVDAKLYDSNTMVIHQVHLVVIHENCWLSWTSANWKGGWVLNDYSTALRLQTFAESPNSTMKTSTVSTDKNVHTCLHTHNCRQSVTETPSVEGKGRGKGLCA